jgi:hypothetical protein
MEKTGYEQRVWTLFVRKIAHEIFGDELSALEELTVENTDLQFKCKRLDDFFVALAKCRDEQEQKYNEEAENAFKRLAERIAMLDPAFMSSNMPAKQNDV